jgi:hypothetical protein
MGQKSSIDKLDPRIREEVDRLIRDGRATIDQIVDALRGLGADVSRSAVGRYVQNANAQLEKYRQAQDVAKVWIARLDEEPEGDVGRLLSEMLRTVAFQTISSLDDGEEAASAGDIFFLAKAIRELAGADKTVADRILKVRETTKKEAADKAAKVAKKGGLSDEAVETIKREILGVG